MRPETARQWPEGCKAQSICVVLLYFDLLVALCVDETFELTDHVADRHGVPSVLLVVVLSRSWV